MANNKKTTTKKKTTAKTNLNVAKKSTSPKSTGNTTKKKSTGATVDVVKNKNNKQKVGNSKQTKKNAVTKTTKKVSKVNDIKKTRTKPKKENDITLKKIEKVKEEKVVEVVNDTSKKVNIFATIRDNILKVVGKVKPTNKNKNKNKTKKIKTVKVNKNKFVFIKEKLVPKVKKIISFSALKSKLKVKKTNSDFVFTKKTKIAMIVVASICGLVIIGEVGYLFYRQADIDRNTVYYDSLNSLVIDDLDIVAVGSSNFRYSKHYSYTKGLEKARIVRYDKDGKMIFEKMYENGINTTFSSIIEVNDGYIVVGSGEFSKQEQQDSAREAVIIKYDKDGKIVWEKFYQVVTNTRFNKVIATNDGYIAIGQSIYANMEMGNHVTGGGIIVKYDKDGNEVWHNNHGGMKSGNFNDIVEVNGDFYVVGKDASDSGNIVKFDKNGQYKWHKNYSYTDGIGFTGIAYLDNALYVVGSKKILPEDTTEKDARNTTNTDALLVKYDLDGKIIFEKNFGGSSYERYNSILAYRNNLYVVGHTTSTDAGIKIDTDGETMTGILVCYDKNGNILKKKSYGGSNNDNLTDIITDGTVSMYVTAYSNSKDGNITTSKNNGKDYFGKVIKLDLKFRTLMVK